MAGGGKGGSQTTEVKIPAWLEQAAQRNIGRAEELAQIGYTPYYGPDVAALTPMQVEAMRGASAAANAFGLGGGDPMAGMPQAQTFAGGVQGYSSAPLFQQSVDQLQAQRPGQYDAMMAPFINPVTGAAPAAPYGSFTQPSAPPPQMLGATDPWDNGGSDADVRAVGARQSSLQDVYNQQMAQFERNPGISIGQGNTPAQALSNASSSGQGGGK